MLMMMIGILYEGMFLPGLIFDLRRFVFVKNFPNSITVLQALICLARMV